MPKTDNESIIIEQLKAPATRRAAFEVLVGQYSSKLYWQIRHMVTFHDDANDVLQNTFIKAWLALDTFRGESRISTWLYRIAANESLAFLQQRRDTQPLDDADNDLTNTLESDPYFDGDETELRLQLALEQLPPKQRQVFTLKYFDNLKYEEISLILNTSEGALKASYHIAVKKIEEYFQHLD